MTLRMLLSTMGFLIVVRIVDNSLKSYSFNVISVIKNYSYASLENIADTDGNETFRRYF